MAYLAVDLGGSHVACGVVADGVLLACEALSLSDSQSLASLLPALSVPCCGSVTRSVVQSTGLGSGFCGLVHEGKNRIVSTNGKFVDAPDLDLNDWANSNL